MKKSEGVVLRGRKAIPNNLEEFKRSTDSLKGSTIPRVQGFRKC